MELSPYNVRLVIDSRQNGVVTYARDELRRRKVCIVGFEESVKPQAPMNDPSWEIWGMNHANRLGIMKDSQGKLRVDRWFDLHQEHAQSKEDLAWIHTCPVPIYLTDIFSFNLNAVRYPLESIIAAYDGYFASSFAYMLCLADFEGFDEIMLSGVNLNWGRELGVERSNLEYWIGYLRGQHRKITLPDSSLLVKHPYLYGFEYTQEKTYVEARMAKLIFELLSYQEINELVCKQIVNHKMTIEQLFPTLLPEIQKLRKEPHVTTA